VTKPPPIFIEKMPLGPLFSPKTLHTNRLAAGTSASDVSYQEFTNFAIWNSKSRQVVFDAESNVEFDVWFDSLRADSNSSDQFTDSSILDTQTWKLEDLLAPIKSEEYPRPQSTTTLVDTLYNPEHTYSSITKTISSSLKRDSEDDGLDEASRKRQRVYIC
jgi:hypothetical protein